MTFNPTNPAPPTTNIEPNRSPDWLWRPSGIEELIRQGSRCDLSDFITCRAVELSAAERAEVSSPNCYSLRCGHPRLLADSWKDFYVEVGRIYGFTQQHDWGRQRAGLESLFRGFFGSTAVRSQVGWVSLITLQRPQHLRYWEDALIQVQREHVRLGKSLPVGTEWIGAGWHRQAGDVFCYQSTGCPDRVSLRHSELCRRLQAPAYWPQPQRWIEWRYVPAVDGEHDAILQAGQIPSMVTSGNRIAASVGTNGYLNLVMVALPQHGHPLFLNNTLEIAAESGRIVSIRAYEAPLVTGLLAASSIERRTLAELVKTSKET